MFNMKSKNFIQTLLLLCVLWKNCICHCPLNCICSDDSIGCTHRRLVAVPTNIPADIKVLDLRFNSITNIPVGFLKNLTHLNILLLNSNLLTGLQNGVFDGLISLKHVYLNKNKITTIEDDVFRNLEALEYLYLENNRLTVIQDKLFNGLFNLKRLFLHNNKLQKISDNAFDELYSLIHLRLDGNPLTCSCEIYRLVYHLSGNPANDIELSGSCYLPVEVRGKSLLALNGNIDPKCTIPELIEAPKETVIEVESSTSVFLPCKAKGIPEPRIVWTKDSYEIGVGSLPFAEAQKNGLNISSVSNVHAGKYRCLAVNKYAHVQSGSVTLIVKETKFEPPKLTDYFEGGTINSSTTLSLHCAANGFPQPVITWFKDGRSVVPNSRISINNANNESWLKVENTKESDSGMYTCMAQNTLNSIENSKEIRVKNYGPKPPIMKIKPFDINTLERTSVEIPCVLEGEPFPEVLWFKDEEPLNLIENHHRISKHGSLRLYNVSIYDSGLYECVARNKYGRISATGTLTVVSPEKSKMEEHILKAYREANLEIDRAINATIEQLFAYKPKDAVSPSMLMKIFRYPDNDTRSIVKPADVYTRTLDNVRKHILAGIKLNLTNEEFSYEDIFTEEQLELIATLSGCAVHQLSPNCTDVTFHSKYSNVNGTCNNLQHPRWGASHTALRRILRPIYENGFSTPVGWNKGYKYFGFEKPPARLVSTTIIKTDTVSPDSEITHMVMQWGQFIDHDLDHSLPSTTAESWDGRDCKKTCAYAEPCFPMEVPPGDSRIKNRRCMDFIRTSAICGSGPTSVFFNKLQYREQINQLTSYMDASQIYGFTRDRSFLLRELLSDLGLLRAGIKSESGKEYLPTAGFNEVDCRRDLIESDIGCFLAGDIRVNEQVGLIAMHTIWFREHNRVATKLHNLNPHWDGETLYNEARKVVIAEMQHITYTDWLPHIVGPSGMDMLGKYKGYNSNIDVSISNVFATAAMRFGHSLINPVLSRLDENFRTIPQGNLTLGKAFFAPWRVVNEGGIDPLLRGFFTDPAKRKKPQQNLNSELTDHLFTSAHAVSLDLASLNIQRSRDHGLPGYTAYKKFCNLSVPETFDQLSIHISDKDVRDKLRLLYGHPGNIDIWVGGILEDQLENARVGPTFQCLLVEQFQKIRDGDRFWYENPTTFTVSQLEEIRRASLAKVLCDNGDNITKITRNVFLLPEKENSLIDCLSLPTVNLEAWREKIH